MTVRYRYSLELLIHIATLATLLYLAWTAFERVSSSILVATGLGAVATIVLVGDDIRKILQ